jgi:hypothetical protein
MSSKKYFVEIGEISNSFECVSEEFQYQTTNHYYTKCKCVNCNQEKIIRTDIFVKKLIKCKNCIYNERKKGIVLENVPKWYFNSIKNLASQRDLEFSITLEDLQKLWEKQEKKCALTGIEIGFGLEYETLGNGYQRLTNSHRLTTASLDRIECEKGYTLENIQWVEKNINIFKNALNNDDFIGLCKLVAEYNINKKVNFEPSFLQGYHKRYRKKKVQRLTPEQPKQ